MKEVLAEDVEIWLGDCRDIFPMLGKVDAVVTDPPYGVDLEGYRDDELFIKSEIVPRVVEATRLGKSSGVATGARNLFSYPAPRSIGCVFFANGTGLGPWGFECFHPILYYGKDPYLMERLGSRPNSIYPRCWASENVGHPCPKPVDWMKWQVERTSLNGWVVLDPFMGSGSTGVAAVKLGRRFIGIEIEPKYYEIAKRRISEALCQPDMFIERPKPPKQEALL